MENEKLVVALEIGTSKICAAAAVFESDGHIRIEDFVEKIISPDAEILKNGIIETVAGTSDIIDELLESISANQDLDLEDININVSNPSINSTIHSGSIIRNSEGKQVVQGDIDKLVEDVRNSFDLKRDRSVLHHFPLEFSLNGNPTGAHAVGRLANNIKADFTFITSNSEPIERIYYTLQDVKSKVKAAEPSNLKIEFMLNNSIANAFALLDDVIEDKRNGVAIVDIGADLTDIVILHNNSVKSIVTIPIAGNAISQDLMSTFGLNFEEAEKLKKLCGCLPFAEVADSDVITVDRTNGLIDIEILLKNAITVVQWRLKEIAALVNVELQKAGFSKDNLTNGLILCGGTANMVIAKDIFNEITKIRNIRNAKYNPKINFGQFENLLKPEYSTLIGLLMPVNHSFDSRVSNRVLRHSPISVIEATKVYETRTETKAKPTPPKEKKRGIGDFFKKNIFNSDTDLNDTY